MKKQITQRQKDELARRKAMPIALIQRPLKHIAERDQTRTTDKFGNVNVEMGARYMAARIFANAGRGEFVRAIAASM